DPFGVVRRPDADPLARQEAERQQPARKGINPLLEVAIAPAQLLVPHDQRVMFAEPLDGAVEMDADRLADQRDRAGAMDIARLRHPLTSSPLMPWPAGKAGARPERLLDAQRLVPFGHPLRAGERADLELPDAPADRQMDDRHILTFARAGRDDRIPASGARRVERRLRLADRAGLVRFDQHGV